MRGMTEIEPKESFFNAAFSRFARKASVFGGSPATFTFAVGLLILWAVTGPWFNFSDTWQLVINTGTTIVTFLMVFLIQHTQNRDTEAIHLKLDEIIRAIDGAHNSLLDLQETPEDLDKIKKRYAKL